MDIAFAPNYLLPLPPGHRFPMLKYELLPEQLLHEGTATAGDFFSPTPPPLADVLLTHEAAYLHRLLHGQLTRAEERASGFPWSPALAAREMTLLGGTIGCARRVLAGGGGSAQHRGGHPPRFCQSARGLLPAQRPGGGGQLAAGPRAGAGAPNPDY